MAIENFDEETKPLDGNELKVLPIIVKGLKLRVGNASAISNKEICRKMNQDISDGCYKDIPRTFKLSSARVRKIIHQIRMEGNLPLLCATASGYFVAESRSEAEIYIKGLRERISSIQGVAKAFVLQFNEKYSASQNTLF